MDAEEDTLGINYDLQLEVLLESEENLEEREIHIILFCPTCNVANSGLWVVQHLKYKHSVEYRSHL